MQELERRLRSALTELAEEVPPSHNAWMEHGRRLALKSRRARVRPALMAAVAAAVVALIAVPVMILNLKPSGVEPGTIPTSTTSAPISELPRSVADSGSDRYTPVAGEQILTPPYVVTNIDKGTGEYWETLMYTAYQDKLNGAALCSITLPQGAKVNGEQQAKLGVKPTCSPLKPPAKRLLWFQGFVPNGNGAYVYVMAPQVNSVLVWSSNGYMLGYRVGLAKDFAIMLVQLGTSTPQKYTARDQNNGTLENGE